MLGVKDNVDLKELEKYGFKKEYEDGEYFYGKHLSDNVHKLFVYESDRKILQGEFILIFGSGVVELDVDNVQDLIQAGLVEKVQREKTKWIF